MDCQMPVMDGYESTRSIRRLPGHKGRIPIVAFTAHAMKGERERCLDAGMNDFLTKPVNRHELLQIIQKHVKPSARQNKLTRVPRILLVDDDENYLKSLVRFFRKNLPKYKIETADNGIQACTFLGSFLPDLIVLDIQMPHMSGVELVKFIRSNSRYANTQVIGITGLAEHSVEVKALRALGVERIFHKPFDNRLVLDSILELIENTERE
ncbi:MAG: response regulator, partial [Planctomycetes bacterium]|nr:response regulator [Planctomycetota bacterium]